MGERVESIGAGWYPCNKHGGKKEESTLGIRPSGIVSLMISSANGTESS